VKQRPSAWRPERHPTRGRRDGRRFGLPETSSRHSYLTMPSILKGVPQAHCCFARAARALCAVAAALTPGVALWVQQVVPTDRVATHIRAAGLDSSYLPALAFSLLDSIGPRLTGSPGLTNAAEWLVRTYRQWGVSARTEAYGTWSGWKRGTVRSTLMSASTERARTVGVTMPPTQLMPPPSRFLAYESMSCCVSDATSQFAPKKPISVFTRASASRLVLMQLSRWLAASEQNRRHISPNVSVRALSDATPRNNSARRVLPNLSASSRLQVPIHRRFFPRLATQTSRKNLPPLRS
jgi:hypothetical protein